jgi:hypothetical protein
VRRRPVSLTTAQLQIPGVQFAFVADKGNEVHKDGPFPSGRHLHE